MERIRFGCLVLAVVWTCLPAGAGAGDSVSPRVELDHTHVMVGQTVPVYALVEFEVAEARKDPAATRQNLNLGLVIDRSGSMADKGKITYARKAAKILVDGLKPRDRLAVVEYDDRITVLWPSSLVESPAMIKRMIDKLEPRGSTNLTGGMLEGKNEVVKHLDAQRLNRVILLSDGLANVGITDPRRIQRLVRKAKAKGIHFSTMGLGTDYNEDLMEAIAESGGGNYYFIEHPNQMARIFQQEMSILFATVAKNVRLEFASLAPVTRAEFIGFTGAGNGRVTAIEQEDFYSSEKRSVVLRLEVTSADPGQVELGVLRLRYEDLADNREKTIERHLIVQGTRDPAEVARSENTRATAEATLSEADRQHDQSVKDYEQGKKKQALAKVKKLSGELQKKNQKLKDVRIAKKIEALQMEAEEMDEADQSRWARFRYLKSSKIRYYKSKRGKKGLYVLQEGDSGTEVEEVQRALIKEQFFAGPVDGKFTPKMTEAVKMFQTQHGLDPDGVVGPRTMKKLGVY